MGFTVLDARQRFFEAKPASVGLARGFATMTLKSWRLTGLVEDIRLCVSELASNALLHGTEAGHGFLVRMAADGDFVCLEVHDSRGSDRPPEVRCPDATDTSGRGLLLVTALADGWGVEKREPFGKIVWSRFKIGEEAGAVSYAVSSA